MNIAFTSLVIVLFLLPGIVSLRAYFSGVFSDEFVERLDKLSVAQLVVRAILPSLSLHYLGLQISGAMDWGTIDFEQLISLLIGRKEDSFATPFSENLSIWQGRIVLYNLVVNAVAFILGSAARIVVRSYRWDRKYQLFRYANEWHYLLSGEILEIQKQIEGAAQDHVDLRYVTAMVDVNDQTMIITGILENYKLSRDKGVRYLTLSEARRRPLSWDAKPEQEGYEAFYQLPGNYLVIPFQEIKNLHIEYIQLNKIAQAEADPGSSTADPPLT